MLCSKILNSHKIGSGIFLSAIFSVFFSFFFLNTNTFAVSDLVYSFTSDSAFVQSFASKSDISSYDYLIISISPVRSFASSGNNYGFDFNLDRVLIRSTVPYTSSDFFYLPHNPNSTYGFGWSSVPSGGYSGILSPGQTLTFTFTNTPPSFPSSCPPAPSGSITLSQNGTYDVSSYAEAVVDVPPVMGDYHDDLIRIINAIYCCAGVMITIYFFYCIYRLIIKNTGDKS